MKALYPQARGAAKPEPFTRRGGPKGIITPMRRRSLLARSATAFAAFTLVFAQVAMAAFAPPAAMPEMVVEMAAADGCHEADPGAKHVCLKTCQAEPQKDEAPTLAALPAAPDAGLRIQFPVASFPQGRLVGASFLAHAAAPPPHLLFARFLK